MNNEEKKIALSHISHILTQANIPHLYNVSEETISLRNVDMTDVLLELHFYQDEYISDLKKRNFELEKDLSELTIKDNYQRVISDKNEQISVLEIIITNLQNQITKMHNFENCDYQKHIQDCPIFNSGRSISCKKCPHWRLQESNDEIHD